VRALRHERRLEKKRLSVSPQASQSGQGEAVAWDPARDILRGQALWRRDAFAAAADIDEVMSSAIDVAAEMSAKTYGPSEVGGGRLLTMWPPDQTPTFVSVTARPAPREIEYDREATRRLEAEIQGPLEDMASDAISWGHASSSIYERESRLQHLTGLGA
jgi:hypothetical protein